MNALIALYSTLAYGIFLGTFLYAIGFVQNILVPKSIDSGAVGDAAASLALNAGLLAIFALQHSIMARRGFKRLWTRVVPETAERSTYVLAASLALLLLFWQWRPLPQLVWSLDDPWVAAPLLVLGWLGWATVLGSTFMISHVHLFGLSQGFARLRRRAPAPADFKTPALYRWLRHPIYAGFVVAFWATPTMSLGHLLFAVATTGYILIGIWFEERDLVAQFGDRYRAYRASVGMMWPKLRGPNAGHRGAGKLS